MMINKFFYLKYILHYYSYNGNEEQKQGENDKRSVININWPRWLKRILRTTEGQVRFQCRRRALRSRSAKSHNNQINLPRYLSDNTSI